MLTQKIVAPLIIVQVKTIVCDRAQKQEVIDVHSYYEGRLHGHVVTVHTSRRGRTLSSK